LDSTLVTNEVVNCIIRQEKKRAVRIEIIYEKPYDSMRWEFMYYMMSRLDFISKWIGWIKGCMESFTIFVLVNRSLT